MFKRIMRSFNGDLVKVERGISDIEAESMVEEEMIPFEGVVAVSIGFATGNLIEYKREDTE